MYTTVTFWGLKLTYLCTSVCTFIDTDWCYRNIVYFSKINCRQTYLHTRVGTYISQVPAHISDVLFRALVVQSVCCKYTKAEIKMNNKNNNKYVCILRIAEGTLVYSHTSTINTTE